jgi:drug/metabolite transporter (DMT)-like permease
VAAITALRSKSSSALGVFAILVATACWSSAGVLVKYADQPGVVVAFWRLLIVAGIFGTLALLQRRPISWFMMRRSLPGGMLFGVNLAVFFEALRHTTVGIATVLAALVPVLALFVGNRFFDEPIAPVAALCAAGAVAGVVVFVLPGFDASGGAALGLVLSALAVTLWVAYLFATKRARSGVGTIEYLFCMGSVAAVSLIPFMVLFTEEGLALPTRGWGWIIALAVIPGTIGHGLLAWAQAHVPMSTSGILLQGEPIGAAVAGAIFLDETLGPVQALGLLIAFTALAVLTRRSTAEPHLEPTD